ncbi:MAG: hypothetical protein JRC86_07275, partial [Deltaproteobacteria bacterium]|nr:hypothetical protein [Deltaproteobacteria bacterium]
KLDNMKPSQCFLMWLPDETVQNGNIELKASSMSPGRIIKEPESLGEMVELIGDGDNFKESIERMTRRTFFNYSAPGGCVIPGTGSKNNIFVSPDATPIAADFPARCRNLDNAGFAKYCYPAAVIEVDQTSGTQRLYFENVTGGYSWYYEVQPGDPTGTPFLVHPGRTGASSSSGMKVSTTIDHFIELSATVNNGATMIVYNHSLFEGPYWTS